MFIAHGHKEQIWHTEVKNVCFVIHGDNFQHFMVDRLFMAIYTIDEYEDVKSLRPSDACMRRLTSTPLDQIKACRLFGAKPLSEPMLTYCQLEL